MRDINSYLDINNNLCTKKISQCTHQEGGGGLATRVNMDKFFITSIDINHNSLKAMVIKPKGHRYVLCDYKELLIKESIIAENNILNHHEMVNVLKELKKTLPFRARKVAISVPDSAVISKRLQVEQNLTESEREFAIIQAFSHQSPFPVEELSLDFILLEPKQESLGSDQYQVFATRKEVLDARIKMMHEAGFQTVLADVHSHCLGQIWQLAVASFPDKSQHALLDIGTNHSSFTMFTQYDELFYKEFVHEPCQMPSMLQPFVQQIVERVKRYIHLYRSLHGSRHIDGIWLSGQSLYLAQLTDILSEQLALECCLLNPLGLFDVKSVHENDFEAQQQFTAAAGLAIRGIQWLGSEHALSR